MAGWDPWDLGDRNSKEALINQFYQESNRGSGFSLRIKNHWQRQIRNTFSFWSKGMGSICSGNYAGDFWNK